MNNDQLTAISREYAEWITKAEGCNNTYIPAEQAIASALLRWLSQRYCLVEKSKLREAYKDAQKDQYNSEGDFALTLAGRNRSAVLVELFPEIVKEVENG